MAITRGQMQRQLRRGGGIMNIAPREQFGLGSSLKKFVRKVIPNEISKVATVAAPFVAPFNPALAGAMAGIGSFDQSGSISDALKRGALTYGGGQAARFIGGAGFQGNPFVQGGAFTPSGFTGGFSSPVGTDTGIGKLFKKSPEIEAISGTDFQQFKETPFGAEDVLGGEMLTKGATQTAKDVVTTTAKDASSKGVFELIKQGNYTDAAVEAGKKGLKSIFTTPITNAKGEVTGSKLDKTALLAAGTFGLTYLDAKKIADDAGVDIGTETEYDEATKDEFKEKYAGYLTNFFGGKKNGGRIGFALGTNELRQMAKEMFGKDDLRLLTRDELDQLREEFDIKRGRVEEAQGGRIGFRFGDKVEDKEGILSMMDKDKDDEDMDDLMAGGIKFNKQERAYLYKRLGSSYTSGKSKSMPNLFYILNNPGSYPQDAAILKRIAIMGLSGKKEGGRIGFESGANKKFKFMELIEDDTDEKEKLINALLENAREKFPEASEEDIFNFVMSKAAPMSNLMVDGKFVRSTDIETPSIKLSRDMGGPRYDFLMGGEVPVRKNKAGIEELDYRQSGGFVPVGVKEKADDVPAMLSKNEFVLTADAVRGIGGGDVEKGAEKLYGVMKQAEKVGRA